MSEIGESVTVLEASTGKVLSTHKVSLKPSPSKAAPVEVMFAPNANPPVVHITNMMEGTLWAGLWDPIPRLLESLVTGASPDAYDLGFARSG